MPLSAVVDGELVCAALLDDGQWSALRGNQVELPCGHNGFARVSHLGTQHFVHSRGSQCGQGESAEHLHVKAVVARAVAALGWAAKTEAPGAGFVADVLAQREGVSVAIEVQRSRQVLRDYERRQDVYAGAGIRCVWLVRDVPAGYVAGPELPVFRVQQWHGEPRSVVTGRSVTVAGLVGALLSGQCRWRGEFPASELSMETLRLMCPMCGGCREVQTARWLRGRCRCGVPLLHAAGAPSYVERARCCGYWGPGFPLDRRITARRVQTDMAAGHWCLSS